MLKIIDSVDSGYKDNIVDTNDLYFFWNKLIDYAVYWEINSPTVNGNPDYNTLTGFIQGFLFAKKLTMIEEPTKIIIKNGRNQTLIEMTKRPMPQHYYDTKKEISDTINQLLNN